MAAKMRGASAGTLIGVVVTVSACTLPSEPLVNGDIELRTAAFKNQFVANPIHERITVEGLPFLRRDVSNYLALANAVIDRNHVAQADTHFDNCTFELSSLKIARAYRDAVANVFTFPAVLQCPTFYDSPVDCIAIGNTGALGYFAQALHALQDFYAHTNWVEILNATGAPRLLDSETTPFPVITGGLNLGGMIVIDEDNQGWVPRPVPANRPYPESVLPWACRQGQCLPALVSGRVAFDGPAHCPPTQRLGHDDLAKDDDAPGRLYTEARALAVAQTRNEWCRLVGLVRVEHGQAGDSALYDQWVETSDETKWRDARCGEPVDLRSATDTEPSGSVPLEPGTSRTYNIAFQNAGPGTAYGPRWSGRFSGAVSSIGPATLATGNGATACEISGLTVSCRAGAALASGAVATVEVSLTGAAPGSIAVVATAASNNPDTASGNDGATISLLVECPPQAPTWDPALGACVSPKQLTVSKSGSGSGFVSGPGGLSCGSTCQASFPVGTTVSLAATPDGGSTFLGWQGACAPNGVVTMDDDRSCDAIFTSSNASCERWYPFERDVTYHSGCSSYTRHETFYVLLRQWANPNISPRTRVSVAGNMPLFGTNVSFSFPLTNTLACFDGGYIDPFDPNHPCTRRFRSCWVFGESNELPSSVTVSYNPSDGTNVTATVPSCLL